MARQARAEATRQTIIDAAVALFNDVGYGDVDMIDIIDAAGTTKGTCYYYFPTKESLAAAIIEQASDQIEEFTFDAANPAGSAMQEFISATFRFIVITETDELVKAGYRLRQAVDQISAAAARSYAGRVSVFTGAIQRAIAEGDVRSSLDPEQVGYSILAGLVGCRLLSDALPGDDPFKRLAQVWLTILPTIASKKSLASLEDFVRSAQRSHKRKRTAALRG